MMMNMVATCLLGVEGIVADDLRSMDAQNVSAENGRVFFDGDETILARANIWSRMERSFFTIFLQVNKAFMGGDSTTLFLCGR